jgi:hypothetical protein
MTTNHPIKFFYHAVAGIVVIVIAVLGSARPAQASYIVTLEQVGSNVVANGSGTIDLTGLTLFAPVASEAPFIDPHVGFIYTGFTPEDQVTYYMGASGPGSFGSGSQTYANSGIGRIVGIRGNLVVVPWMYLSGNPLSNTATYNNATFTSLGVTPGIYEWTWGTGAHLDYFELQIGPGQPTPESGSTLGLLCVSFIALVGVGSAIGLTNLRPTNKKL